MRNFEDDRSGFEDEEYKDDEPKTEKKERAKQTSQKKSTGARIEGKSAKKVPVHAVEQSARGQKFVHQAMPYFLIGLALFTAICFLLIDVFPGVKEEYGVGSFGRAIRNFFCGTFGFAAFFIPAVLGVLALTWGRAVESNGLLAKNLYALFSVISLSTLMHVIYATVTKHGGLEASGFFGKVRELFCPLSATTLNTSGSFPPARRQHARNTTARNAVATDV